MKKTLLAILLIFAFCSMGAAEMENSPDGFRGIKWGDPPSKLGKRTLVETRDEGGYTFTAYARDADSMSIGKASLSRILYCFCDNEFSSVSIYPENNNDDNLRLCLAFLTLYGKPSSVDNESRDDTTLYKWEDEDVYISYSFRHDTTEALFSPRGSISSKHIAEKYKVKNQEYIKKDFGAPNGFRGVKWGDPPSKLGKRVLVETNSEVGYTITIYTRDADSMSIGKASLLGIFYLFYDNEFAAVTILPEQEIEDSHQLFMAFSTLYGKPTEYHELDDDTSLDIWEDNDALIFYLEYDMDMWSSGSLAFIFSKHINEKYGVKAQEYIKKGF